MDKLWGVEEVADFLGIPSVQTIYQWRTKGYGPPATKVGKYIKFWPDEVRAWVKAQPRDAA